METIIKNGKCHTLRHNDLSTTNRIAVVENFLLDLKYPHDDRCVKYIVLEWELDHEEQLADENYEGFEIDRNDVDVYWHSFVGNLIH